MRSKFNRYAILPKTCTVCHELVWMEPYRKSEVFSPIKGFIKKTICRKCIGKFNVGVK